MMRSREVILKIFLIVGCSVLVAACQPLSNCPMSVGDEVVHLGTGRVGEVRSVDSWGSLTSNCRVAVYFEDGTWSRSEKFYDSKYIFGWTLKKVSEVK